MRQPVRQQAYIDVEEVPEPTVVCERRSEGVALRKQRRRRVHAHQPERDDIAKDHKLLRDQSLAVTEIEIADWPIAVPAELLPALQLDPDHPSGLLPYRGPK